MLELHGVTKRYESVVALDGVSFGVGRGQLVGFLGPNGAGKTTAMRAILGLVGIDAGTITWDGEPITADFRRRIGYMPAERGMYPKMRVREHVVYYARLSGMARRDAETEADRWLERVDLTERAGDEVQALSSGNQQRVQLILALVSTPELLVLDEPFSGLDPIAAEVLKEVVLERVEAGTALLLSSHQLDLVADVSRDVVIVDHGRVVLEGAVDAIRSALPERYVDISFARSTPWRPSGSGVEVVAASDGQLRLRTPPDIDLSALLADAEGQAPVTSFSFAPPGLSEAFIAAVRGGHAPATIAPDGSAAGRESPSSGEASP